MKVLLIFIFLFPCLCFSQLDLNVGANGRTYPSFGGGLKLRAGYNIPLMGTISPSDLFYSMIRVQTELSTAGVVSHHDSSILLYPLSFIAIGAGRKEMKSTYEDFTYYDCEEVRCEGVMNKDYFMGKIALGAGNFISSFQYYEFRNSYDDPKDDNFGVAEYEYTIIANPKNDTSTKRIYFAGLKLDQSILGLLTNQIDYKESKQRFQEHYLLYRKTFDQIDLTLGAGNLYSTEIKPGPTGIFQIRYRIFNNNALF